MTKIQWVRFAGETIPGEDVEGVFMGSVSVIRLKTGHTIETTFGVTVRYEPEVKG